MTSEMDHETPKLERFWQTEPVSMSQGRLEHALNLGVSAGIHSHTHPPSVANSLLAAVTRGGGTGGAECINQYERNLNFATATVDESDYGYPKKKTVRVSNSLISRDILQDSKRIIEKRRRDRMNNCLADLARLLPPSSLRKGRGRIEKTEIVELAIKHLRHLQCHPCPSGDKCEFNYIAKGTRIPQDPASVGVNPLGPINNNMILASAGNAEEHFRLGFNECLSEMMHFLVEEEGMYPGDSLCLRILKHLREHSDNLMREHFSKDGKLRFPTNADTTGIVIKQEDGASSKKHCDGLSDMNNGSSNSSGYQANGSSSSSDANGTREAESPPGSESMTIQSLGPTNNDSRRNEDNTQQGPDSDEENENSCSTHLSLDMSECTSVGSKTSSVNKQNSNKPPIPSLICSNSSIPKSSSSSAAPISSSSSGRYSNSADEGQDGSEGNSASRYKFKNNIKQRFVADLIPGEEKGQGKSSKKDAVLPTTAQSDTEVDTGKAGGRSDEGEEAEDACSSKSYPVTKRKEALHMSSLKIDKINCESMPTMKIQQETEEIKLEKEGVLSKPVPITTMIDITEDEKSPSNRISPHREKVGIPAFALHEKGLFYIPLTIDRALLDPYISKIDMDNSPPLHPVTISVCFMFPAPERPRLGSITKEAAPMTISHPIAFPSLQKTPTSLPPMITTLRPNPGLNLKTVAPPRSSPKEVTPVNFSVSRGGTLSSQTQSQSGGHYNSPPFPVQHSRQVNTVPLPYPSPTSRKEYSSQQSHQQYYNHHPHPAEREREHNTTTLPQHSYINGYASSSGGSSTSSTSNLGGRQNNNNREKESRKRSIPTATSPLSGSRSGSSSSSLGYYSSSSAYHQDKYSPDLVPFYNSQSSTHSSSSSPARQISISSVGTHLHPHSHPNLPIPHHAALAAGYGITATGHLIPLRDMMREERERSELEIGRNCYSPTINKRAKKSSREAEDILLKQKPFPVGLPMIPLPRHD